MKADLDIAVRDGQQRDAEPLARIRSHHLASIADARGGALLTETDQAHNGDDHRGHFARILASSDHHLVVGTLDGYPFGYGVLSVVSLGAGRLLGTIEELVVEADAREVSLGEAIMKELVDHAGARGCFGIDSRALPGDRQTKNFFESFGLKARMLVVHKALGQPED